MSVQFREIRATLEDSMETVITIENRADLIKYLRWLLPFELELEPDQISLEAYSSDDRRNGWHNYLVRVDGLGVVGFTDGLL